ncbi:hypothetical protein THTE_0019 [Thermogutta terrifontis]|uniref:Uncharacterized protein n=1 Tax=Thermogutta terrifontis TaxID=1331910 RepID=A0A286R9I6_9BACT|nr:hypothetical protein THTE_0019 [Thermogutta terrifontis]
MPEKKEHVMNGGRGTRLSIAWIGGSGSTPTGQLRSARANGKIGEG